MNIPLPLTDRIEQTRKATKKIPASPIESAFHDIINQLSVISLCCCELHNSVAEKFEADQLAEFKKIEVSVQQTAAMIQRVKAILKDREDYAGMR